MGYNSTLIVLNDCLHDIENDPEFGKKVSEAISSLHRYKRVDISSGPSVNAATVVDCHHADHTALIAVGGNCATVLSQYVCGYMHHTDQAKKNILRSLADEMGYRIVKKTKKNKIDNREA